MGRTMGVFRRFKCSALIGAGAILIGCPLSVVRAQTTAEYNLNITSNTGDNPDYNLADLDITFDTQTDQIIEVSGTAESTPVTRGSGAFEPENFNYADPVSSDDYINAYIFLQNDNIGEFAIIPNMGGNNEYGVPGEDYLNVSINGPYFFYVTDVSLTRVLSAAPEPSAWALMIVGVGLVGLVLRHRLRQSPSALTV